MSSLLDNTQNLAIFKDCLARRVLPTLAIQDTDSAEHDTNSAEQLDDFTSFLTNQVWPSIPHALRTASYSARDSLTISNTDDTDPGGVLRQALTTVPLSVSDTLTAFCLVPDSEAAFTLLLSVLTDYISEVCAPPPVWSRTRADVDACEICGRSDEDIPLTYHHLIPRSVHAKALKRKWHEEYMLNSVAWLCRPCHSTVHRVASNEDLARHFYTLDRLLEREDIQRWRAYAAKQRPSVKRG